jgi:hypothetical protein
MPQGSNPRYDPSHHVFTMDVVLEPDHDYELWLNGGSFWSFQSEAGIPLPSTAWRFRTGRRRG